MSLESDRVLIIGAGATGLLIAQGLKRAGIAFEVFERQSLERYNARSGTWGMALHWSLPNVKACLPPELFAKLQTAETDPWTDILEEHAKTIPLLNGKTGDLITHVKADGPRRVHRGRLRNLFRTGLEVHFGMELTDLTIENDIVTTVFNNGASVWKGRYLVGADGPRSEVRSFLVPPGTSELHPSPITVFNFGASFNEKEAHYLRNKIHSVATLAPHPEQKTYFFLTLADVPNPEAPETWLFQVSLSFWNEGEQPQTFEDRMRIFKKLGANYCEPYRSVVSWVNEDIKIPLDHFATWKNIQPWKNYGGKVTIAGDAAHPMVPYRAQGLNNALEDAGHYVRAITSVVNGKGNLSSIMEAYDADAYNRGKNDMTTSDEQMYACHHWDALMKTPLITDGFTKRQ